MSNSTAVSCIVYDLDGTLIDSVGDIAAAVNRVREHFGLPGLSEDTVKPLIGDGARRLLERAVFGLCENPAHRPERTLPKRAADVDDLLEHFVSVYHEDPVAKTKLYPGAEIMIRFWRKQGVAQAVLTNKPHRIAEEILDRLEMRSLLELIVGRGRETDDGEELPPKPDPANIDFILVQTGAPREETWMVGDGLPDLEAAKNAQIPCIAILGGYTEPQRLIELLPDLELAVPTLKDADQLLRRRMGL